MTSLRAFRPAGMNWPLLSARCSRIAPDSKTLTAAIRTVRVVVIDDRRHPVVRADREKFRLELVALADIDRDRAVFEPAFLEHDADLPAVRRRPVIEVDHRGSLSRSGDHERLYLAVDRAGTEARRRARRPLHRSPRPSGTDRGPRSRCAAAFPGRSRSPDRAARERGCGGRQSRCRCAKTRRPQARRRFSRRRDTRAACARENTAGRPGTARRRLRVTTSANSFSSMRSQTLNTNRPPGRKTRSASRYPSPCRGKTSRRTGRRRHRTTDPGTAERSRRPAAIARARRRALPPRNRASAG